MNLSDLFDSVYPFAGKLVTQLSDNGLLEGCKGLEMDHICVRQSDPEVVKLLHMQFGYIGMTISDAVVNGRTIYIIKLNKPLFVGPWKTSVIELPYPKPTHLYADGWEHVEFVLPSKPTIEGIDEAYNKLFPNVSTFYEIRQPEVDADQLPNPSLEIVLDGIGVKFHPHSIQKVVGYKNPR